jgi:hypothetical protein
VTNTTTVKDASQEDRAKEVVVTLVNRAYDRAKRWAGGVLSLQVVLFLSGIVAIFWPTVTLTYPWIALPLAFVAAFIAGRASKFKGMAESLKRTHEYLSGFAHKPSGSRLADLKQSLSAGLAPEADELLKKGITYSSSEKPGPRRILENLSESAWYTKHLSLSCAYGLGTIFLTAFAVAITLLVLSATSLAGTVVGLASAKCVAATLLFLMSIGMIRSVLAYYKMSQTSDSIDAEACQLLSRAEEPTVFEAQRLLAEYQLARAAAPLVPTWVWKFRRNSLNEDWEIKRPTK